MPTSSAGGNLGILSQKKLPEFGNSALEKLQESWESRNSVLGKPDLGISGFYPWKSSGDLGFLSWKSSGNFLAGLWDLLESSWSFSRWFSLVFSPAQKPWKRCWEGTGISWDPPAHSLAPCVPNPSWSPRKSSGKGPKIP